jgi:hypothetical protein
MQPLRPLLPPDRGGQRRKRGWRRPHRRPWRREEHRVAEKQPLTEVEKEVRGMAEPLAAAFSAQKAAASWCAAPSATGAPHRPRAPKYGGRLLHPPLIHEQQSLAWGCTLVSWTPFCSPVTSIHYSSY